MRSSRGHVPGLALVWVLAALAPVTAVADGAGSSWSAPTKLTKAQKAIGSERYPAALRELNRLRDEDPADADVLNLLGFTHRKLGDF